MARRQTVMLAHPGWASPPLALARRVGERFAGITAVPAGHGVLLRARSVHGFGLRIALGLVVIGPGGQVIGLHLLRPGSVVWFGARSWVAEIPARWPLPSIGSRLRVTRARPILAGCPER